MIHRTEEGQSALFEEIPEKGGGTRKRRAGSGSPIASDFGLTAPSQLVKNYVLDTNVLLHDPAALERFKENHLCILVDVLAELDKFKSEQTERGANARRVHRRLTDMFSSSEQVTHGVTTEGGGTVRLVIYDPASCPKNSDQLNRFHRVFPDRERVDHRILAACLLLMQYNQAPVVLVTKDINMQLKARAVGIECQDYLNDKVDAREVSNYEVRRVEVDPSELHRFASTGDLPIADDRIQGVAVNEYVLLGAGEAALAEVERLERLAVGDFQNIGDEEGEVEQEGEADAQGGEGQ